MKTIRDMIRGKLAILIALACATTVSAQTSVGQWDFESGTLASTSGSALTYADLTTQSATQFGSTTALGIPDINGTQALVMGFPAATNGMGYLMPDPFNPNGGGSQVNEWTLIMDVLYPGTSDGQERPIIDTDGNIFVAGPDFAISASGGVGVPGGPSYGILLPNTWYRVGITVTAASLTAYINGSVVGSGAGAGLDNRFSLTPSATSLILGTTLQNAAAGYVNSIQLRDVALSAGQMLALGGPSAAGIPQTIPPVPSYIQSRTPGVNATGIAPSPNITVVLNQGDNVVNSGSIKLLMDGVDLNATINPNAPTFEATASITTVLDPKSIHALTLQWQDNQAGARSESWSFTILDYQKVNLPASFYFENFDALTEDESGPGPLPPGWTVSNQSSPGNAGFSLDDRNSESYLNWVLVSNDRFSNWNADRTNLPPIVLNGEMLTSLASGNLMWAESDQRCGGCAGQFQELYTADIDCTAKTNVYVAWKSIYMQNQDNMNACEYSIDQGQTWLPVRYLFCTAGNGESSDIYYTNNAAGTPVIDVGQTFYTVEPNRNWSPDTTPVHATNYAIYVKAPISTDMIPYIFGYTNDINVSGKEIVVVRIPKADGQSKVRFRFLDTGTSAWFWGIDELGLYEINTPTVTAQPKDQKVNAGESATFSVTASSATALTYQWKHSGTNISDAGHYSGATTATLTVSNCETNEAGSYVCVVGNLYGSISSAGAVLTVVAAPEVVTQPVMVVGSIGTPASLTVAAMGRPPLHYQWARDGVPVGTDSSTLTINSLQLTDSGRYQVTVTNTEGSAVSSAARLVVTPASITSDLVVHLTFDNNYDDTSGRGNNATAQGSPSFAAGRIGQAMSFTTMKDGSRFDYASLGYPDDLKFVATTDFAISFWANYSVMEDDPALISNKNWNSSGNRGWGIFTQSGSNFRANVTAAGGTKYDTSTTPTVHDGTWHQIVISYGRGGIVSLYVDGVLGSTSPDLTTGNIDTDDLGNSVNIGQDGTGSYTDSGGAQIENALIDDVGIWRRVLSAQEVLAIYNAALQSKDLSQADITAPAIKPVFSLEPTNTTAGLNDTAVFRSLAAGTPPLAYQWFFNGDQIAGGNTPNYTIAAVQSTNAGNYQVIVTNSAGSITSTVASLTFGGLVAPAITTQPASTTVGEDLTASFQVQATGTLPLAYQWYFGTTPIAGATTAALTISHVRLEDAGAYSVVVSNVVTTQTSTAATLTVTPAPKVQITGQWDFDDADLRATVGSALTNFNATVGTDTTFGTTTSFGIPDIAGAAAKVLYFVPSTPPWGGYIMPHGAATNGGGVYVNRYTVIYDVLYPASSDAKWRSLLQTATGNNNDGDFFVNPANGIGISGDYQGTVTAGAWTRIVGVFDLPYSTLKRYINGAPVGAMTLGDGTDGRWSLDPTALLFADEDGDANPGYVNSIQFRNGIMSDAEVAALGGVTTDGIPGMRPSISGIASTGSSVVITWQGAPGLKLQQNTTLDAAGWTDVPGTTGASTATVPIVGGAGFFRLAQ